MVYKVRDTVMHRLLALKTLNPGAPPGAEPAIEPQPPAKPRPSVKEVRREVAVWKRPLTVGIAAGAVVLALVLTYLLSPGPNQDDLRLLAQAESLLANKKLGRAVDLKPQLENVQGKLAGRAQDVLSGITNLSKQEESKWQIAQEAEKGHDFERARRNYQDVIQLEGPRARDAQKRLEDLETLQAPAPPPLPFREPKVKLLISHKSAMVGDLSSVSPDYIDSNFDFDPKPRVSESVSRKGKSGLVQLILDVDGDGSVLNSSVFNDDSTGQVGDDLAKEALNWHFKQPTYHGNKVKKVPSVGVQVEFSSAR